MADVSVLYHQALTLVEATRHAAEEEVAMLSYSEFVDLVRDALANLYDPIHLQTHAIASQLALRPATGENTGESLRRLFIETIESLRPSGSMPRDDPAWDDFDILQYHYLRSLSPAETRTELSISNATFYRRQKRALEAAASILWEHHRPSAAESGVSTGSLSEGAHHIRVDPASTEPVSLGQLLGGIRETIAPLASLEGIELRIATPETGLIIHVNLPVFRQIVLGALSYWITHCSGETVHLDVDVQDRVLRWRVRGTLDAEDSGADLLDGIRSRLPQDLLGLYGGRMQVATDDSGEATLVVTVPMSTLRTVLIIDDDPETIDLYRRYLVGHRYTVMEARSADEAEQLLEETKPDAILLDVILPRRDGWTVLKHLRGSPRLGDIPIVVCSVLEEPELALAWGATRVLTKPVIARQLLEALEQSLGPVDTAG